MSSKRIYKVWGRFLFNQEGGVKLPRAARFTVENGTYHVMTRVNNRNNIYGTKEFVEKMKEEGLKPVWSHAGRPKIYEEVTRA